MKRAITLAIPLLALAFLDLAVFAVVVLGLGRPPAGAEVRWLAVSLVAAALCALAYSLAHPRLARLADRVAYGDRHSSREQLRALTSELTRTVPIDEVLLHVAESLRHRLALDTAELWTGSGGALERRASDPERGPATLRLGESEAGLLSRGGVSGPAWISVWLPQILEGRDQTDLRVAPIVESGELLGLIVVGRAPGREAFGREDEDVLHELGRQIGLALRNSQLDSELRSSLEELTRRSEELRESRARLVVASDAERRRIERDLHDGAQQQLVAVAIKAGLARDLAESDPTEAKVVLGQLTAEVHSALDGLRDLAHGVYPPLLLERGLGEALGAAVGRRAAGGRVEAAHVGRYSPEIEATVYFCCLEALQNAAKHAGENATVRIRVWETEEGLQFEVADNGPGFDQSSRRSGAGLTNMRDRIGAIGGTLAVDTAPNAGTRIRGAIPLES